jgi:hypothetical protein
MCSQCWGQLCPTDHTNLLDYDGVRCRVRLFFSLKWSEFHQLYVSMRYEAKFAKTNSYTSHN